MSTRCDIAVAGNLLLRYDVLGDAIDNRGHLAEVYIERHESSPNSCVSLRLTEYLTREQVASLRALCDRILSP